MSRRRGTPANTVRITCANCGRNHADFTVTGDGPAVLRLARHARFVALSGGAYGAACPCGVRVVVTGAVLVKWSANQRATVPAWKTLRYYVGGVA